MSSATNQFRPMAATPVSNTRMMALVATAAYTVAIGFLLSFQPAMFQAVADSLASLAGLKRMTFDPATSARLGPIILALGVQYLLCAYYNTPASYAAVAAGKLLAAGVWSTPVAGLVASGVLPSIMSAFAAFNVLEALALAYYSRGMLAIMKSVRMPSTRGIITAVFGLYIMWAGYMITYNNAAWVALNQSWAKPLGLKVWKESKQTAAALGPPIISEGVSFLLAGLTDDQGWQRAAMFSAPLLSAVWAFQVLTGKAPSLMLLHAAVNMAVVMALATFSPERRVGPMLSPMTAGAGRQQTTETTVARTTTTAKTD